MDHHTGLTRNEWRYTKKADRTEGNIQLYREFQKQEPRGEGAL
jgi:hypothetical protein